MVQDQSWGIRLEIGNNRTETRALNEEMWQGLWTQKGLSQPLGQSQEGFCLPPMALVHGCGAAGELLAQSGPRIIFCLFYISTCFVFYSFLFSHLSCCQTRAEFLLQREESAKQQTCWRVGSSRPPRKDILRDRGLTQSQQIRQPLPISANACKEMIQIFKTKTIFQRT